MLDSWEICQPSAWAFQTMPHNVLDSPEKQPGAWKLPAHHLNSLIWALSGSPSPCLSLSLSLCLRAHLSASLSMHLIFSPNSPSKHSFSVTNTLSQIPSLYIFILPIPYPWTHNQHFFQPFTKSLCHRVVYLFFHSFPPIPLLLLRSSIL